MNRIPQSSPTMRRLFGIFLALMTATLAALGQTNASANVRELSLQECIELTLKHNLDLKIDRYNPEIQLYALQADYGAYDPTFSLSGQHDHRETGNTFGGFVFNASKTDDNQFNSSI